jgi:hypothetical protein
LQKNLPPMSLLDLFTQKPGQPASVRKFLTEKRLEKEGIPVNPQLPLIDDYKSVKLRNPKDVARRILILSVVIEIAYGKSPTSKAEAAAWLHSTDLSKYAANSEIHFLTKDTDDHVLKPQLSWRVEAQKVLFWSIGLIDKLNFPSEVSTETAEAHKKGLEAFGSIKQLIKHARLRDREEILDELDYILRLHAAVRQAQSSQTPIPGNANPGIVYERHYAFNWLIHYAEAWDDVTCDI